jgi:uncharacterized protein (DUF1800 family)
VLKKSCKRLAAVVWIVLAMSFASQAFAAVTVAISPTNPGVAKGFDKQFALQVTGAMDSSVIWSVNNIPNGDPMVGWISNSGKYTAPSGAATGTQVTVRATSVEDSNAVGTATVTIMNAPGVITSVQPGSFYVGPISFAVNGYNFLNGAVVKWNGTSLPTTFVNSQKLTATYNAPNTGGFSVTVVNPVAASSSGYTVWVGGNGPPVPPPPPPPPAVSITIGPLNPAILLGGSQQFNATVQNTANTVVTWTVNGTPGDPGVGFITNGLYSSPAQMPVISVLTITATSVADNTKKASTTLTIKNPQAISQGRFADQVTFGATPVDITRIQQLGVDAYIDEQFSLPESPLPIDSASKGEAMDAFWGNARAGKDQLRQRVIYALSEVIVISFNKNVNGDMVIPWLKILSKNAFGNYKQLLKDITLDGGMGHYLDLANSGGGGAPNENYPREVMQLFSIGLNQLDDYGQPILDPNTNKPIPTYSQADVVGLARALTGWTWNSPGGTVSAGGNNSFFPGPMLPMPNRHSQGPKTFLGQTIPAGGSINSDFDAAMTIIMNHPNVGPFISTRLIRALVTSNPSPQYIKDVTDVFNNNGQNVKGDMKAVIKAILTHAEARNDNPGPAFGRLRTPEQYLIAVARNLNLGLYGISGSNYLLEDMHEGVLDAPSVFGHYSPMFKVPKGGGLFGPEFQIYSPSDAVNRANFLYGMLYYYPQNPALSPYINLATNPQALVDAVDNAMLFGRMSPTLRNAILNSLAAMPDDNQRAIEAIYLTAMSGEFLIQR